jgi:hypothetical protein
MKISDRDKRMLLLLVLFFVGLGYYYYVFTPLENMSVESAKELNRKRAQLNIKQVKIRQFNTWRDYCKKLGGKVVRIQKMIKAPGVDKSVYDRIDFIMKAAQSSSVEIDNLKPIPTENNSGDGSETTGKKVIDRFMIDGRCTFLAFLKLMNNVYGMEMGQVTLSSTGESNGKLRFSLILTSLPKVKLDLSKIKGIKAKAIDYKMNHDLFELKSLTDVEKKLTPEEIRKKMEKQLKAKLSGLKLEGTATIDGRKLVIISDPDFKNRMFKTFHDGDMVRGVEIVKIGDSTVQFMNKKGISCELNMDGNASLSYTSSPDSILKNAGKARLGLDVHVLDPEYSKLMGLKEKTGLLILKSKKGCDLRNGDIIKKIAGVRILTVKDALQCLNKFRPGNIVKVTFLRDGKEQISSVKLD